MSVPAVISSTIANLVAAKLSTPQDNSGDFHYLKMGKSGEWVYGADETEIDPNSAFVIDPDSYAQGFIAWGDGELLDEKMAVAGAPPVTRADLPNVGAKWDDQVAFALKGVEGKEDGMQFLYKVSSRGGKAAVAKLLSQIIERGQAGEMAICPVVLLETTSYKHKKFGKIFTPVLTVDEWVDLPAKGEQPAPAPEPEPEPAPEPVKPTRKRRARNAA
jgi:hypothetical protein